MKKLSLQKEGFDPRLVPDPVYFYDAEKGAYTPLDQRLYADIIQMKCRL